ncbi:MAG: hypothetical protein IIC91_03685 [Chloroflexi bacterium]|nr:hypothetical protein [Chloroflexota bacterium]
MNINRIKVLGLLGLPLLAIAVAVMVFAIGHSSDNNAEAATSPSAMSLRVDSGDTFACAGGPSAGKVCVPLGAKFNVIVVGDGIPVDGYILAQAWIDYDKEGLVYKPGVTAIWPDVSVDTITNIDFPDLNAAGGGGLTGVVTTPASFYKGDLFSFSFTCTSGPSSSQLELIPSGTAPALTNGAIYTAGDASSTQIVPDVTGLTVNCNPGPTATPTATPPPIPRMQKCDQADNVEEGVKDFPDCSSLVNVFLTRQGAKIPPDACLVTKGTSANVGELAEKLSATIVSPDPKDTSSFQQVAAFEFEVHYDSTKVCVDINKGPDWAAAEAVCIIQDDQPDSKPQLEGVARIGCVTIGKGHGIDDLAVLATVDIFPQPEIYSQAKPNQNNGVVVQINNVGCDLGDEQGHAIPLFSCDDADITFRYLEGDVSPDCVVDAIDTQSIAFRWGTSKGSLIYKDFMNLEPSGTQADNDIDINDLQFVFGRFGSTCKAPHPDQDPVNPKA